MPKYKITYAKSYKKSIKKLDNSDIMLVENIIDRLANDEILEQKYNNHRLKGNLNGLFECHVKPNLLLIYSKDSEMINYKSLSTMQVVVSLLEK